VIDDGRALRCDDGLPLQRVKCSRCRRSWTLRPAFLYPHRSFQLDVVQAAATKYLAEEDGTYQRVAGCFRVLGSVGLALGGLAREPARRAAAAG
jgi:hypothetical protein